MTLLELQDCWNSTAPLEGLRLEGNRVRELSMRYEIILGTELGFGG